MRKLICIALLLLVSSLSTQVMAHPGRTDGSGGHTCRTNCPKWGYSYGEYHYHNGGESSSSSSTSHAQMMYEQDYESGYAAAQRDLTYDTLDDMERSLAMGDYSEGYKAGFRAVYRAAMELLAQQNAYYDDGYVHGYALEDLQPLLDNVPESFTIYFTNGFYTGQSNKISELREEAKVIGYDDSITLAERQAISTVESVQQAYTDRYNEGYAITKEKVEEQAYAQGYEMKEADDVTQKVDMYQDLYNQAYTKGYEERLSEVEQEGYAAALQSDTPNVPIMYQPIESAAQAFVKGFERNDYAHEIKDAALEDGKKFVIRRYESYVAQYPDAEPIYKLYYEQGKAHAVETYKTIGQNSAFGAGALGAIGGAIVWKRKKKRKQKKTL